MKMEKNKNLEKNEQLRSRFFSKKYTEILKLKIILDYYDLSSVILYLSIFFKRKNSTKLFQK